MTRVAMTEKQFQQALTDLCDYRHLTWHHETDSRRSKRGFPDLVIVGSRVIFVELKSEKGRLRPDQIQWIKALEEAGAEVYVWRPSDMEHAKDVLLGL